MSRPTRNRVSNRAIIYYDVTLAARGTTRLSNASVTIDRLTIDGPTSLDIASTGSLRALGEFNQYRGWTNIDGTLHTGEAFILSGLLSGSGTFRAPWLTTVAAAVAPGGADRVGTLTVDGNMIMASGSALFIEAGSAGADLLAVTGSLSLSDPGDASSGASLVFNKAPGAAPRHGQSFTIVTAGSGIEGRFGSVYSFQGVLRPELTYGENSITALLRAGSLVTILEGQDLTALAFASALDALRGTSYNSLYGLYGAIDLMDGRMLSATLAGLTPRITGETRILQDRQSRVMMGVVTDRLSMLGTDASAGLSIVGAPHALMAQSAQRASVQQGFAGLTPSAQQLGNMPKGVTGFVSGGVTAAPSSYGERVGVQSDQRNWHVGAGLETEVSDGLTVGTAFGYATGSSAPGLDRTSSKMAQAALYGSYRLGDGFYVGGVAAVERAEADQSRQASDGQSMLDLHGAAESVRYSAVAEAGVNIAAAPGVTLTPRLQLGYADYRIGGFRENGGELALQIDEVKLQRLEARMGARLAGATRIGDGWSLMPQIQADYVQLLSGSTDGMQVRFANAGDHAFGLPLAGGDASWGEVKGGVKLTKGKLEFGAGVETAVGRSAFRDDRAVADITFRF
jgi:subtilase-type serine protease